MVSKPEFDILKQSPHWSCCLCNSEMFPFNGLIDDNEFELAINELAIQLPSYSLSDLDKKLFNPFEFDVDDDNFIDIDPDVNYFANSNMQYSQSSYYTDEKFNSTVSNSDQSMNEAFSLFHINIRSMPKNIDKLYNFFKPPQHQIYVYCYN